MRYIPANQIQAEVTVCPYCMELVGSEVRSCCGENSAHFAKAYDLGDEYVLADEVAVIEWTIAKTTGGAE